MRSTSCWTTPRATARTPTGPRPEDVGWEGSRSPPLTTLPAPLRAWTSTKPHSSSVPARRRCHLPRCSSPWPREREVARQPARLHRDGPIRGAGRRGPASPVARRRLSRDGRAHPMGGHTTRLSCGQSASTAAPGTSPAAAPSRSWHSRLRPARVSPPDANRHGLDVDPTAPRIRFAVTVGVNFFMEIAKIRALRMLWSRVVAARGRQRGLAEDLAARPHLALEQDRRRPLQQSAARHGRGVRRGASAAATACRSGAFDEVIRPPDDFSLRIARNTQMVLQKECQLDQCHGSGRRFLVRRDARPPNSPRAPGRCSRKSRNRAAWKPRWRRVPPENRRRHGGEKSSRPSLAARDSIVGVNQYANPEGKAARRLPRLDEGVPQNGAPSRWPRTARRSTTQADIVLSTTRRDRGAQGGRPDRRVR